MLALATLRHHACDKPAEPHQQCGSEDDARRTTRVVVRAYGRCPPLVQIRQPNERCWATQWGDGETKEEKMDVHTCDHPACSCQVTGEGRFCSPGCQEASKDVAKNNTCHCKHAQCAPHA